MNDNDRVVVSVDMDIQCAECGKGGATQSGICLKCATKAIEGKTMKSRQGQQAQMRFMALKNSIRRAK